MQQASNSNWPGEPWLRGSSFNPFTPRYPSPPRLLTRGIASAKLRQIQDNL